MGVTIGCAVAAEHIRHFRPRAGHRLEKIRSALVVPVLVQRQQDAATGPEDWTSSRPCWSRYASTGPWWRGCDDRGGVEWSGDRYRIRGDAQQMRAEANAA